MLVTETVSVEFTVSENVADGDCSSLTDRVFVTMADPDSLQLLSSVWDCDGDLLVLDPDFDCVVSDESVSVKEMLNVRRDSVRVGEPSSVGVSDRDGEADEDSDPECPGPDTDELLVRLMSDVGLLEWERTRDIDQVPLGALEGEFVSDGSVVFVGAVDVSLFDSDSSLLTLLLFDGLPVHDRVRLAVALGLTLSDALGDCRVGDAVSVIDVAAVVSRATPASKDVTMVSIICRFLKGTGGRWSRETARSGPCMHPQSLV